jgi:hypothetical protein
MDGRVLVDGGAMNNVPADVVRDLGADVVIAVNVGAAADKTTVNYTIFGLMGGTVDAMMRASTREAMKAATIVITPALDGFGSLDWRRNSELAEQGYRAAEAIRDQLLPLALGEQAWADYVARRRERRRDTLPVPAFVQIEGAASADERTMVERLEPQLGQPINLDTLEATLATFGGLGRLGADLSGRRARPAGTGAQPATCASVLHARDRPRKHHDRRVQLRAGGSLPHVRRGGVGVGDAHRCSGRLDAVSGRRIAEAARDVAPLLGPYRSGEEAAPEPHPGRSDRRSI